MALAAGRTEAQLIAACELFADAARPIPLIRPVVDSISGFIAVIPAEPSAELQRLAADCTRAFDFFRAPLTPEDRARRNPEKLTPRQCEYLDRWGYPYVMEEFRFHMTLTGRLPAERRDERGGDAAKPFCRDRSCDAGDRPDRPVSSGRRGVPLSDHRPLAVARQQPKAQPVQRPARHTGFSSSVTGEVITRNTRSVNPEFEIACSTPGGRKMKSCLRTTWFLPAISISPSPSSTW